MRKTSNQPMIFCTIFLLSIFVLAAMTGCSRNSGPGVPLIDENKTPMAIEPAAQEKTAVQAIPLNKDCGEGTAVGYRSCVYLANGDINVTLEKKPSARVNVNASLIGADLIFLSLEKDLITKENVPVGNMTVEGRADQGKAIAYIVFLSKYPKTERLEIRPIIQDKSGKNICYNQRIMVIPKTNCRKA